MSLILRVQRDKKALNMHVTFLFVFSICFEQKYEYYFEQEIRKKLHMEIVK